MNNLELVKSLLKKAIPSCPEIRVELTGSTEWARVSQLGAARFNNVVLDELQKLYVTEQDPDALYTFYVKVDH